MVQHDGAPAAYVLPDAAGVVVAVVLAAVPFAVGVNTPVLGRLPPMNSA